MKRFIFLTILINIICQTIYSQTPSWLWAKGSGIPEPNKITSIAVDDNGNSFVTGEFQGNDISFDTIQLSNSSIDSYDTDIFTVMYNTSGNVVWAQQTGGLYDDFSGGIAIDASTNCYSAGIINSTFSAGSVFVTKYDINGNILWNKYSGICKAQCKSLAVDKYGDLYIVGFFTDDSISFGTTTLSNTSFNNHSEIFIAKYDSSGNFLWAKSLQGNDSDQAWDISTDYAGNFGITGYFTSDSITLGNSTIYKSGNDYDFFIAKFDSSGNVIWAKVCGGNGDDKSYGIASDQNGNTFITGYFSSDSISFDTVTLINPDTNPMFVHSVIFIAKYNTNGNLQWVKTSEGQGDGWGYGITIDKHFNVYVTGFYGDTISFGNNILTSINYATTNIFVAKFDSSANSVWAVSVGETFGGYSLIGVDSNSNSYVAGCYGGDTISFGNYTLTNTSDWHMFFAKLSAGIPVSISGNTVFKIPLITYPNPSNGEINIASKEIIDMIEITNFMGEVIYYDYPKVKSFSIHLFDPGFYFVTVQTKYQRITKKLVIKN